MGNTILTLENLVKFCEEHNLLHYSSSEVGYEIRVHVPSSIYFEEDSSDKGLMKLKIRVLHTGRNRNNSYVSKESAEKAKDSFKNRPILAYIHQLDNGEWDFFSHNMEIKENEDGEQEVEYIERQVGSFTEDEPWFEYDEELDKEYLCAYAVIPEEYTKAADIIRRKNGTKNSCELSINSMTYNAKEKYLELNDWYLVGSTLLGCDEDGNEIGEGMLGSRADEIAFNQSDFILSQDDIDVSTDFFSSSNIDVGYTSLVESLDKLANVISNFNNINLEKGGKVLNKFDELLEKYNKTSDEIEFEVEGLTDDELEAKFAEMFDDNTDELENIDNVVPTQYSIEMSNGEIKNFSLSLNDIQSALSSLVNDSYSESDNAWYFIDVYPDENKVVMYDYWTGNAYRQSYERVENSFALVGERIKVHSTWVSDEEQSNLDAMKNNYSAMQSELDKYHDAENLYKKESMLSSNDYSSISQTEEFSDISSKINEYTVDEMKDKLDTLLLNYAKAGKLSFTKDNTPEENNTSKHPSRFNLPINGSKKKSRYGNLKFEK